MFDVAAGLLNCTTISLMAQRSLRGPRANTTPARLVLRLLIMLGFHGNVAFSNV